MTCPREQSVLHYEHMNEDFRSGAQNFAGETSRNAGKMLATGLTEGLKGLVRFIQEMIRLFLGK